MSQFFLAFCLAFVSTVGFASQSTQAEIFKNVVLSEEVQSLQPTAELLEKSQGLNFVFIGGFFNEISYRYFEDNMQYLEDHHVPKNQIHKLFPSSGKAAEDNIIWLSRELLKIYSQNTKPVVIIAHSKGAAEVLGALVSYPALLKRVQAAFLVQAAVRGSYVADYMMNVGKPLDHKMPWRRRIEFEIKKSTNVMFPHLVNDGLASLTHISMTYLWNKLTKTITKKHTEAIAKKVFYIGSKENPKGISKSIAASGLYVSIYYGSTDGLIKSDEYFLKQLGTNLGLLKNIDHMELFLGFPYSDGPKINRQRFTLALLRLSENLINP